MPISLGIGKRGYISSGICVWTQIHQIICGVIVEADTDGKERRFWWVRIFCGNGSHSRIPTTPYHFKCDGIRGGETLSDPVLWRVNLR